MRMFAPWPADRCAASIHHRQQLLLVFAATADDCEDNEEQSDLSVPAVGSYRGWSLLVVLRRPAPPHRRQRPQYSSNSSQQEPSQTQLAKQAGLCCNHFIYSEKTYNCGSNCSWSEN